MKKQYLSQQIRLMSISTYDLMTDEEWSIYMKIIDCINRGNALDSKDERQKLNDEKKLLHEELKAEITKHDGTPRTVRISNVVNPVKFRDKELPKGVSWYDLKNTKQISEFMSEGARTLGLEDRSITFDKIIVKWNTKSIDIMKQLVFDGFFMDVLHKDGTVEHKHYQMVTSSAGQLRTSKIQALSDEAIQKTEKLKCGMSHDRINSKGGINQNKALAYEALCWSATEVWEDFNIDEAIVIPDFEAPVTGRMLYITNEYEHIKGVNTVSIKHTDGAGVFLPGRFKFANTMVRGPWLKGLISPFDFLKFCEVHGAEPKIKDVWGQEHDLIVEGITVMFTASQLKLWNYYESWDEYKYYFKACGLHMCLTNYEEPYAKDVPMNYQFLQSLYDMTDKEIEQITQPTFDKIIALATDKNVMLRTLGAESNSGNYYQQALKLYPSLLREAYSKDTLRSIKKRMILDAKSGKILLKNKRLFVIPDWYGAMEYYFLGIKEPNGLLAEDEVACKAFIDCDEVDILRSPSLYHEHNVRKVCKRMEVYEWFPSNAIVTSLKDLISRVCQFDCDGDQLNVTSNKTVINVAKRTKEKMDIVPLYYNSFKADPEQLNRQTMFNGFKRAKEFSGIGEISNMLTRLWNKTHIDFDSAADICFYNNQVNTMAPSYSDV